MNTVFFCSSILKILRLDTQAVIKLINYFYISGILSALQKQLPKLMKYISLLCLLFQFLISHIVPDMPLIKSVHFFTIPLFFQS